MGRRSDRDDGHGLVQARRTVRHGNAGGTANGVSVDENGGRGSRAARDPVRAAAAATGKAKSPGRREPPRGLMTSDFRLQTSLAAAHLPRRRRLAAAALGRLRLDLRRVLILLAAAAQALRRRAQTSADALRF